MESLELLNDQYGHCGECHEVHYIPDMVVVDGYYYCKSCSRPTPRAVDGGQAGENNGQVALPTATNA